MNARYRISVDSRQQSMSLVTSPTYVPRAFCVYDVRFIASDSAVKAFMASDSFLPAQMVVLEEDPKFISDASGKGTAAVTSYSMNAISLNVTSSANGFLVLSETYYPQW